MCGYVMTSREFCYWLQGFFELTPQAVSIDGERLRLIKQHLAMVFHHEIDPSYPDSKTLQMLHDNPHLDASNPANQGPNRPRC